MNNVVDLLVIYFVLIIIMLSGLGILVMDKQDEILTKIECKKK